MLESLKTNGRIAADIIRGRALPETLIPNERNHVELVITRANGATEYVDGYNSRTNMGASWQAGVMGSAAGTPAKYVALSTTSITPAATDTTLSGEITSGTNSGLVRTAGTYGGYTAPGSLGGSASYTITNTFVSAATTTVNSAALFDAASAGNLFVEAVLSPAATLASGDSIALTWTVNL
jgi:hypothetical protein